MKSKKSKPKSNGYKPDISFERLTVMMSALESNADLDAIMRAEMHDALDCLYMLQAVRLKASANRRRSEWEMTARIAHELVKQHGASINDAVLAANAGVNSLKDLDSATHHYHVMKKRGSLDWQWISDERVALAASRLNKKGKNGE